MPSGAEDGFGRGGRWRGEEPRGGGGWGEDAQQPQPFRPRRDLQRVCGPNAVRALFLRRPEAVVRLHYTEERRQVAGPLCRYLARHRKSYREGPAEELARIAGTEHHGGIVALAEPRRAIPLRAEEELPPILWSAPLLPVLDGIGNPHNLGAIARSAAFFGCRAMLLSGDPRQADLSDAAFRTAEGALEHLAVFRAEDLGGALLGLRGRGGMVTAAAVPAGGVPPGRVPRGRPLALVLGNEETGPDPAVLAACEGRVTLPGSGLVESLNVSNAAAVLFHALTGEAPQELRPTPPARTKPMAPPPVSPGKLTLPR